MIFFVYDVAESIIGLAILYITLLIRDEEVQAACLALNETAVNIPLVLIRYTIAVLEFD